MQYVNLRPVRLLPGIVAPIRALPGEVDFWVVRENSEGEYSQIGGRLFAGTPEEIVVQESIFTRKGTDRILRYAFDFARKLERKHVTSATKSNGLYYSMPFWDERFAVISAEVPLAEMFGYSNDLRSMTQGKGSFSMEFLKYQKLPAALQEEVVKKALADKK